MKFRLIYSISFPSFKNRIIQNFTQSSLHKLLGVVADQVPRNEINTLKYTVF